MAESAEASRKTTARVVWDTADKYLRNIVDEEDYGDYILPFTVLRRLECMLADSKDAVIKYVDAFAGMPQHLIDIAVKDRFGLGFYNVSPLDLATIASVDDNVDKSLKSYIDGFSNNIADIWVSFDFNRRAKVLAEANRLHAVVKHFSALPLGPNQLSNTGMGDVFEDVMYRAFNKKGKAAGAFYTPRDAIQLMVDVLIANDDDTLAGESALRSIYDPTAGSGGMLLIAQEALKRMNEKIDVTLYGQELMPSAFALGKADLLIQGGRPDAIQQGNTLTVDLYENQTFDYVLSNPPFGKDWSADQKSIRDQAKVPGSRFNHGLPSTSDGQILFLAHCASKLSPAGKNGQGGRAAVVSNASPLFTSDKGPTAIRQWLLEADLIDAVIALPADMFYGTGIATYVWILDTNKDDERKGKIQLIDASGQWEPMTKNMGDKRRRLTKNGRVAVLEAGSGKTKTIAWLSHRLIRHMSADSKSTFDSVVVVTDRTVLDENIRDDMNLVQSSKGLVVAVGEKSGAKSPQLKKALLEGDHIITCTLQTFPEVMKLIEDTQELRGRRWAVVADEAHSSQSGSASRQLKELLADVELEAGEDDIGADDLLMAKDSAIAASANITFVALTATPKAKTLRLFGTQRDDRWEAFDTYTMAQAIEEGFILDVLTNYSTYDMFLRVKSTLDGEETEGEIQVNTGEAVSSIVRYARLHPTAIAQKVRVVVEHFRRNVQPLLGGQARAMVVTSSRMEALSWSRKMDAYIAEKGYELHTLAAFSGSLTDEDGESVTEVSVNGVSDVGSAFREEGVYRVLIVANKFQTGFDEPRLMAMYVDKKLSGVATVQTLSRLNRIYPGKTAPMVVDFRNTPASVQEDFKLYYSDAHVDGDVDPNALITVGERLDTSGLYTHEEMDAVADAFLHGAGGEAIAKALSPIKNRWTGQWRQAVLSKEKAQKEQLESFRADVLGYRNAWQFLSQIVDYQDPELHRRAILATLLGRNLHTVGNDYDDSFLEGVQLSGVKLVPSAIEEDHSLSEGSSEGVKLPIFDGEHSGSAAPKKGPLDEAIDTVNEMFKAKGVDVSPESVSGFITTFWGFLDDNEEAVAMAKNNTVAQLKASEGFSGAVGLAVLKTVNESKEIQSYMTDPAFIGQIADIAADALHAHHRSDPDAGSETEGA